MCSGCGGRTSVTGGTIFDRTRPPLTVWFTACWLFATGKDGISALSLQRTLEVGSYQTAWAMLQRLRSVLVRPGRDRLAGTVAVDETYIGGEESGLRGGRARGKKVLTWPRARRSTSTDRSAGSSCRTAATNFRKRWTTLGRPIARVRRAPASSTCVTSASWAIRLTDRSEIPASRTTSAREWPALSNTWISCRLSIPNILLPFLEDGTFAIPAETVRLLHIHVFDHYRRVERNAQLLEFRCVEFVEDPIYGASSQAAKPVTGA